jgi:hypothetical protein
MDSVQKTLNIPPVGGGLRNLSGIPARFGAQNATINIEGQFLRQGLAACSLTTWEASMSRSPGRSSRRSSVVHSSLGPARACRRARRSEQPPKAAPASGDPAESGLAAVSIVAFAGISLPCSSLYVGWPSQAVASLTSLVIELRPPAVAERIRALAATSGGTPTSHEAGYGRGLTSHETVYEAAPTFEEIDRAQVVKPFWDGVLRKLWFRGVLVKEFRQPAANQERVLDAFQAANWADWIPDPLDPSEEVDCQDRLHNTVKRLNRQTNGLLHFSCDGRACGIRWRPA